MYDSYRLEYRRVSSLFFDHVFFSIFCPHGTDRRVHFRVKRVSTCIYGMTYVRQADIPGGIYELEVFSEDIPRAVFC